MSSLQEETLSKACGFPSPGQTAELLVGPEQELRTMESVLIQERYYDVQFALHMKGDCVINY